MKSLANLKDVLAWNPDSPTHDLRKGRFWTCYRIWKYKSWVDPKALFVLVGILVPAFISVLSVYPVHQMQYNEVQYKEVQYNDNSYPTLLYDGSISIKVESAVHTSALLYQWVSELVAEEGKQDTQHPRPGNQSCETTFSQRIWDFAATNKSEDDLTRKVCGLGESILVCILTNKFTNILFDHLIFFFIRFSLKHLLGN